MATERKLAKLASEQAAGGAWEEKVGPKIPADNHEVWHSIFDKLEITDKPAFSRACAKWHDWVAPGRPKFLVQEVTPIVLETLPSHALLKSRELCRFWTHELNSQYQNHISHILLDFEASAVDGSHIPKLVNRFTSTNEIQRFMDDFTNHPENPFPGKSIHFDWVNLFDHLDREGRRLRGAAPFLEFYAKASELLERFGAHLQAARFDFWESRPDDTELESHFWNCLFYLPNIKRLSIRGENIYDGYFTVHPLPQLQSLVTVDTYRCSRSFVGAVLRDCCIPTNINRLSVTMRPIRFYFCEEIYNFHNLEVLETFVNFEILERFRTLLRVPPLRELSVMIHRYLFDPDRDTSAQRVFVALEPFAGSLTHFQLRNNDLVVSKVGGNWRAINLPKLQRLDFHAFYGSLRILVQFNCLTHLTIGAYVGGHIKQTRNRKEIEIHGFEERMYESNIWRLMPSLQQFQIGTRYYQR